MAENAVMSTTLMIMAGLVALAGMAEERAMPAGEAGGAMVVEDFSGGLANWVWEGPPGSVVEVRDGALVIDPLEAEHREPGFEGVNLWHRQPIAGDFVMEWDLEPVSPRPEDPDAKCNLLFMFSSSYADEALDLIELSQQRTGHYVWLHSSERAVQRHREETGVQVPPMQGYSITYYRMNPDSEDEPYLMVVRRNPGLHLVEKVMQTKQDQWAFRHRVRIEKQGGQIRLYQNDELVLETEDDGSNGEAWGEGYFGLRAWRVKTRVYGVTVRKLDGAAGGE
jgi:hypothetical protein